MKGEEAYEKLTRLWREAATLASCSAVLEWEQQTTMPARGASHRAAQLSLLAGLHHQRVTDGRLADLIAEVEDSPLMSDPLSVPAVNVREIRRAFRKATKLPQSLVEELARTCSLAQDEWAQARKANDFARFQPWLEKVLELTRQRARAMNADAPMYDVLLDDYEQGATTAALTPLFARLRDELTGMVASITSAPRQPNASILERYYPVDRQQVFGEMAAADLGFDFDRGRLDTTTHPFCTTLGPDDCRILTRYNPRFFSESFFGILHEAGHGMYEQGLNPEQFGLPMGEAVSLGIHESQSRLWENQVGRGEAFWKHYYPKARGVFREALADVSLNDFHFAINHVAPSFIRVEADEVTYNLHILIRFELELALLSGHLPVADLPGEWRSKYRNYLGIEPPNDALGCLQDVHWSAGLIGYFPTYTLGNMYGAQLFDRADQDLGGIDALNQKGQFAELLGWLHEKVHRQGKRYLPAELVRSATGAKPSVEPLLRQLKGRFLPLYGLT